MFAVNEAAKNVWKITEDGWVAAYLVVGTERALLIDAGTGAEDIKPVVEGLTSLPYDVIITHNHYDHIDGAKGMANVHCHIQELLDDFHVLGEMPLAVIEGFRFDLGDRLLKVIDLPGHSKGSLGLIDEGNRLAFVGDAVSDTPVWMTDESMDLNQYIATMDKLLALGDKADTWLGCHETVPMNPEWAQRLKTCAEEILKGNYAVEDYDLGDGTLADRAIVGDASMLFTKGVLEKIGC